VAVALFLRRSPDEGRWFGRRAPSPPTRSLPARLIVQDCDDRAMGLRGAVRAWAVPPCRPGSAGCRPGKPNGGRCRRRVAPPGWRSWRSAAAAASGPAAAGFLASLLPCRWRSPTRASRAACAAGWPTPIACARSGGARKSRRPRRTASAAASLSSAAGGRPGAVGPPAAGALLGPVVGSTAGLARDPHRPSRAAAATGDRVMSGSPETVRMRRDRG